MKKFYADESSFKENRKYDFEFCWPIELSMYPPLDTMPSELRDEIKNFAWQMYFRGAQETMRLVEQDFPDWDKEKDEL